ncbi:hypothetical protein DAETH_37730 (plasmid) [Deinococcus aetherius]|uniref:Uncharacterized protein n=1 Tax=Deinococcus aetherius TaxID=200252 RepID=A0ABN6RLP8_9DEIO|nr:hypothetical protein [Deinococcus aetherius]BDP43804.1 hypothetical protein DAETH_37730 [Deinococcus aetherius]
MEVRLLHTYEGHDDREKCSVSEARFKDPAASGTWRLVVNHEASLNSPLFGFEVECADALLDLELWNLHIDTPSPRQRSRLQQIALFPEWLGRLCVSGWPEEVALDSS